MTMKGIGPAALHSVARPGRVENGSPDAAEPITNRTGGPCVAAPSTDPGVRPAWHTPSRALASLSPKTPAVGHDARALYDLARADAPAIAAHFWGEPNRALSRRTEWRWGRRGSRSLALAGPRVGRWHDHETGEGGDAADLAARELGGACAALEWLAERFGSAPSADRPCTRVALYGAGHAAPPMIHSRARTRAYCTENPSADEPDATAKRRHAAELWRDAGPIAGSPADAYLRARLAGRPVPADVLAVGHLRFLPRPALYGRERAPDGAVSTMLARMTDPLTGAFVGVHRTFLDARGAGREKRMLGRGYGVVRLHDPDATADPMPGLAIAEGIETALAVAVRYGWAPVWAALDTGRLAAFPGDAPAGERDAPLAPWALPDTEALTVFADHDAKGAGQRAAASVVRRWRAGGREAEAFASSVLGEDVADLHARMAMPMDGRTEAGR